MEDHCGVISIYCIGCLIHSIICFSAYFNSVEGVFGIQVDNSILLRINAVGFGFVCCGNFSWQLALLLARLTNIARNRLHGAHAAADVAACAAHAARARGT